MPPSAILIALLIAAVALAQNPTPPADTAADHYPDTPPHTPTPPTTPNATPTREGQVPSASATSLLSCNCQDKTRGCDITLDPDPAYRTNLTIRNPHSLPVVIKAGNCTCTATTTTTIYICYTTETQIELGPPADAAVLNLTIVTPNKVLLRGQREILADVTPVILIVIAAPIAIVSLALPLVVSIYRFSRPLWSSSRPEGRGKEGRESWTSFIIPVSLLYLLLFTFIHVELQIFSLLRMKITSFVQYLVYILWVFVLYTVIMHLLFHFMVLRGHLISSRRDLLDAIIFPAVVIVLVMLIMTAPEFYALSTLIILHVPFVLLALVLSLVGLPNALAFAYFIAAISLSFFLFPLSYNLFLSLIILIQYFLYYDFVDLFSQMSFIVLYAVLLFILPWIFVMVPAAGFPRFITPISKVILGLLPTNAEELAARANLAVHSMGDLVEVSVKASYGEWRGLVEYADVVELRIYSEGKSLSLRLDEVDMVEILNIYKPSVKFDDRRCLLDKIEADIIVYGGGVLKDRRSSNPNYIIVEVRKGFHREFYDGAIPLEVKSRDGRMTIEVKYVDQSPCLPFTHIIEIRPGRFIGRWLRIAFDESAPKGISLTVKYNFKGETESFTFCNY